MFQQTEKFAVDLIKNNKPFRSDAALPRIKTTGPGTLSRGLGQVGIGHDDKGVATSQFENALFQQGACFGRYLAPSQVAAGQGNGSHRRMGEHLIDLRRTDQQGPKNLGRESGPLKEFFDGQSTTGHIRGML